jgi:hypothetical protein
MAAGQGSKIEAVDYNEIQGIIGPVLGTIVSNPATAIVNTSRTIGLPYIIVSLGSTTQTQWNTLAGTTGVTYSVGSIFFARAAGAGTGTIREYSVGYGQTVSSSTVSVGTRVSNTQWNNLRSDILRARQHQTGTDLSSSLTVPYYEITVTATQGSSVNTLTTTSTTQLVANLPVIFYGTTIGGIVAGSNYWVKEVVNSTTFKISATQGGAVFALTTGIGSMTCRFGGTKITEADRAAYKLAAQTAYTNRLATMPLNQRAQVTLYPTNSNRYQLTWNGIMSHTSNVQFATYDDLRYFFNGGGFIRIYTERRNGTGGTKNATWTTMLDPSSGMGRIYMNYNSVYSQYDNGNSGQGTGFTGGFYSLTTSDQLVFQQLAPSGFYADNKFRLYARLINGNGGTNSCIRFTAQWRDDSLNPNPTKYGTFGPFGVDELVDGDLEITIDAFYPDGTNVAVSAPTASLAQNQFVSTSSPDDRVIYTIVPDFTSVNEGSSVTYTITSQNVADGTRVYWTNQGSTTAADFTDAVNSGYVTINSNTATLVRTLNNDLSSEGPEFITIQLRTGSTTGPIVASASQVSINDTSNTPVIYSITPTPTGTQNEGTSILYTVGATNLGNGVLFWTNNGTTSAADFTDGQNSGSVSIVSDAGSFTRVVRNDALTEGGETVIIQLRTGSTAGTVVATASTITVTDTSTTLQPAYTVSASSSSIDEGSNVTITLGTNAAVPAGSLWWRITGTGITATDLNLTSLDGVLSVDQPGTSYPIGFSIRNDGTTEGAESFTLTFYTNSSRTTQLSATGNPVTVTINDLSTNLALSSPSGISSATAGSSFTKTVSASGGSGLYTYEVTDGLPPYGVSLNTANGNLNGVPRFGHTATYTITARDSQGYFGSRSYTTTVSQNPVVTAPSSISRNSYWFWRIDYGIPSTSFSWTTNGSFGGSGTLDADGTYSNFATYGGATGTFTYVFTFSGSVQRTVIITSN